MRLARSVFVSVLVVAPLFAVPTLANPSAPEVDLERLELSKDGATAPIAGGGTARLTLDPALERETNTLLTEARPEEGAALLIDMRGGKLLAWAGTRDGTPSPGVGLSLLAPAASLFKIITTTALLEKRVNPDRTVCIEGGHTRISRENLTRPKSGRALCAPFRDALGRSRNAVFAQLATRFLSAGDLVRYADRFGLGHDAPFDARVPIGTLQVPDGDLEFARASAGFVGSRLSVVGAAELAYTVAAHGRLMELHVVESAPGYDAPARAHAALRVMRESTAWELRKMMEGTVDSGTSREVFTDADGRSFLGAVRVAGKTGTLRLGDGPTTSWFVGFAPSRAPRVVVAVLLQNGRLWRRKANEIGRDVLRAYFAARGARGVTAPDEADPAHDETDRATSDDL